MRFQGSSSDEPAQFRYEYGIVNKKSSFKVQSTMHRRLIRQSEAIMVEPSNLITRCPVETSLR